MIMPANQRALRRKTGNPGGLPGITGNLAEYVLDYLTNGFPTARYERYTDEEGHLHSRPVVIDGQPVQSNEAIEIGAEVTGRNRRIVKKFSSDGSTRLAVENRPASANRAETQSYMDGKKRILVFSDAGGTGRSYHADLSVRKQRKRVHYLLEPGWKAGTAIQGLGRSNPTNQAQPPLFRPVTTDVKGASFPSSHWRSRQDRRHNPPASHRTAPGQHGALQALGPDSPRHR
jgi:hypothetical protein